MSHSKGLFSGTCPGNFRKYGKPRDGKQQWKCGRCSQIKIKKARRCWFFHSFRDYRQADHGYQPQKCEKCGWGRALRVTGCGMFKRCRWHNCTRIPDLMHCRRCARPYPGTA